MTLVKICGLTHAEDVRATLAAGADWLGFIHVPGTPRHRSREELIPLLAAAEGAVRVLVVRNADEETLAELRATLPFEHFQFHGDEPADYLTRFGGYKVFHIEASDNRPTPPDTFGTPYLLDTAVRGMRGGTGKTFAWDILADMPRKFLVAGGLTPENVGDLVAAYRPWGVDVCSGVEASPGRKDLRKLKHFIENVRRQDS